MQCDGKATWFIEGDAEAGADLDFFKIKKPAARLEPLLGLRAVPEEMRIGFYDIKRVTGEYLELFQRAADRSL